MHVKIGRRWSICWLFPNFYDFNHKISVETQFSLPAKVVGGGGRIIAYQTLSLINCYDMSSFLGKVRNSRMTIGQFTTLINSVTFVQ